MKICRYNDGKFGVVDTVAGLVRDVTEVLVSALPTHSYPYPTHDVLIANLDAVLPALAAALDNAPTIAIDDVRFLTPVANPGKLIGAPVNYHDHLTESKADEGISQGRDISNAKISTWGLFLKANSSLVGPSEGVALRQPYTDRENRNDHEVELAVIIGRKGTYISRHDAMDYVAAYTIGVDMTLRGPHTETFRKSIDTYAVLGPWMVTKEEFGDCSDVDLKIWVNDELRQSSSTRHLVYDVPRLIEWASSFYTLYPGDVIFTGTPAGVSPVHAGDIMVCEVAGVGRMTIAVRQG